VLQGRDEGQPDGFPVGGHLGREPRGWTDPVIFTKVIMPWELQLIAQSREAAN